jgi:hypothetical protein
MTHWIVERIMSISLQGQNESYAEWTVRDINSSRMLTSWLIKCYLLWHIYIIHILWQVYLKRMFIQEQTRRTKYVEIAAKRGQGTTDWKFKKTSNDIDIILSTIQCVITSHIYLHVVFIALLLHLSRSPFYKFLLYPICF